MSPQQLCDLLDALRITTKDAAKRMGVSRATLTMYCNGRRYPSHGGTVIESVPPWLSRLAKSLR